MTAENETPVYSLVYGQREADGFLRFQTIQETYRAGTPDEWETLNGRGDLRSRDD